MVPEQRPADARRFSFTGDYFVLGGDNQRIHEEIIMAGGQIREGRFSHEMNVSDTETAAAAATGDSAPGFIEDRLKELWAKVEAPLIQSLEARIQERTKNLQKFLDERSEREVANVTAIMQELERSIRETLNGTRRTTKCSSTGANRRSNSC